jgi:hypothetical protein
VEKYNLIVGVVCAVCSSAFFGHMVGVVHTQQRAIVAGAGRWTINPKSGISSFEFVSENQLELSPLDTSRSVGRLSPIESEHFDPADLGLSSETRARPANQLTARR